MTQEYYARVDYTYSGGSAIFSIPFLYMNKNHIVVIKNGDTENPITDLTFNTSSQIQINSTLIAGDIISIRRITPLDDRFVVFTDGNILDEEAQNLSALQVFNVVQEIKDNNDWLISQMSEFIALKNYIDSIVVSINKALSSIDTATSYYQKAQQLVDDISNDYEDLKEQVEDGLKTTVNRNLFEMVFTDRTLSADESVGLALQGTEQKASDYPDAYDTLSTEYTNGTAKTYKSADDLTYSKVYTGSILSNFEVNNNSTVYQTLYGANYSTYGATKFTSTGSPTISDAGVLSGVSASDYVTISTSGMTYTNKLEIIIPIERTTLGNQEWWLATSTNSASDGGFWLGINTSGYIRYFISSGTSSSWDISSNENGSNYFTTTNQKIYMKIEFTGTQYIFSYSFDRVNWTVDKTIDSTTIVPIHNVDIRLGYGASSAYFRGKYYLPEISIKTDGSFVFKGAKTGTDTVSIDGVSTSIPYTETSTGYKIVDVEYRDTVEDMFDEYGYAPYYTIDEDNQNYTLPKAKEFYIASSSSIAAETNIYFDKALSKQIGEIDSATSKSVKKFTGSSSGAFYTTAALAADVTAYSDKACTVSIGTVAGVKETEVNKYTLSSSGTVYTASDVNLRVGRELFSDVALSVSAGTITAMNTVTSNKYKVAGLSVDNFYVPKDTVIKVNTVIYSDAGCTTSIGTVTQKGTIVTSKSYYYNIKDCNVITGAGTAELYCYTKNELSGDYQPLYSDIACTTPLKYGIYNLEARLYNGVIVVHCINDPDRISFYMNYSLISSSTNTSSAYITVNDTQCTYYKQATVEADVLKVDNGSNQSYQLVEAGKSYKCVKIGSGAYQTYTTEGDFSLYSATIDLGDVTTAAEAVEYIGLSPASTGTIIEYKEASNGHKIVSSTYKAVVSAISGNEFYVLDTANQKFTLPSPNTDTKKKLYYCLGNTAIVQSGLAGVSKDELNNTLENYVRSDDEMFQAILSIISNYNATVGNINSALTEVLGE